VEAGDKETGHRTEEAWGRGNGVEQKRQVTERKGVEQKKQRTKGGGVEQIW